MPLPFPRQRRGNVTLRVSRCHKHQRYRGQPPPSPVHEPGNRFGQRWWGQLDEAAGDGYLDAGADPLDEPAELFGPFGVGGTVAGDQQWDHASGSP